MNSSRTLLRAQSLSEEEPVLLGILMEVTIIAIERTSSDLSTSSDCNIIDTSVNSAVDRAVCQFTHDFERIA